MSAACSACYGSGYGVDEKPCPCGCRPRPAPAIAQPVAAGSVDTVAFNLREHRVGGGQEVDLLNLTINAWGAQQRQYGWDQCATLSQEAIRQQRERAEKAEKQWHNWIDCSNYWQGRAEKAEARAAHLDHFFKHHSLQVPPQYTALHVLEDGHPNAIDPSDTPC